MTQKFQVKILRLKTGEDIICFCYEDFLNAKYVVKHAKLIHVNFDGDTGEEEYYLSDWMNHNIFAYPEIKLGIDDVLFSNYATVYFGSLYLEELLDHPDLEEELADGIKETLENISDSLDEMEDSIKEKRILH